MANDYYTADNTHLLAAKKMATWRNGDAKLQAANVHAIDEFIVGQLFEPVGIATPMATGASFLPRFKVTQYAPGVWDEYLHFQSAMNLYPALGGCTTAGGAAPYTHTFALRTTQSAVNQGRHFERENNTESERIDILGLLMNSCHIECSEAAPVAVQHNKWFVARTLNTGTDDIAASPLTDKPFEWPNFTFPTLTYNSETLECTVVGWAFDVVNTAFFTGLDTNGYYSIGKYTPLTQLVTTLEIIPYGKNVFELIRDTISGSTGQYVTASTDLDLTVKCERSTNDYVQWLHDKCYCQPFIIKAEKTSGKVERYLLVFSQLDQGSLTPTAKDSYDNTYYEGT